MSESSLQTTKQQQRSPPIHPMMKLLNTYHQKLKAQQDQCQTKINEVKQHVYQQFQKQFQIQFNIFQQQFYKQKHLISDQLKTVEYYLQNFISKHSLNPKENNLYPLFNQIDKKLTQNYNFIQNNFNFQYKYPQSKEQLNNKLNYIKADIMEKELQEIRSFLAHNQNIRKYCNKQLQQIKQIHDAFGNIYAIAQKKYFTPELNFTGTLDQVLLILSLSQNIQKLNIGIRNKSGKMSIDQLKTVINNLLKSRNLLTHVNIKIMDMEFEEQKCSVVKMFVKQLKIVKNFKFQNYYKENKLGMFEDFTWYPLKKETHIIGKVW